MGRASKNFHHSSLAGKPSFTQMPKSPSSPNNLALVNPVSLIKKSPAPSIPTGRKDLKHI